MVTYRGLTGIIIETRSFSLYFRSMIVKYAKHINRNQSRRLFSAQLFTFTEILKYQTIGGRYFLETVLKLYLRFIITYFFG